MLIPGIRQAVTIITGASSGIGRSCALEYANAGAIVVLAARDAGLLRNMADRIRQDGHAEPLVVPTDVTNPDEVLRLAEVTMKAFGRIDIVVCNAGVGLYSPVLTLPEHALRRVFEVNFFGVVRTVQAALPHMLERRSGLVQIISSVIGVRAVPGYSGYCATKFALSALAESLRVEVAGSGLRVQMIYPGLTDTSFSANSILRGPARSYRLRPVPPEKVARVIVRAASGRSRDQYVSLGGRLLGTLSKVSPSLVDRIMARLMNPRGSG